ncbi:hypothetical protein KUTeg_021587 [Tegillarca granosa]|uniref:Uncharacterized protein n=1 Tax=Tegillarca granosa TaxID=220873 RepID=A0ABQ9E3R4_TEGGR|nr:hypothetical protein KUTeg_021587 [Tegillarca granosa]
MKHKFVYSVSKNNNNQSNLDDKLMSYSFSFEKQSLTFVKILYTDYQDAVFYICKKVQDDGSCNSQDMLVFVLSKTGNQINGYWYEIAHTYSPIFTWHSMIVYYQADQFKLGYSGARPEDNVCVGPALGLTKPRCTPTTADFLAPWKILYTDYDTALIPYSCMKVLPDGSCAPYFRRLHILTRNKTISPDLRTKLNSIVAQTCIDPASLLDVTHSVDCKPLIDSVFNPEVKGSIISLTCAKVFISYNDDLFKIQ